MGEIGRDVLTPFKTGTGITSYPVLPTTYCQHKLPVLSWKCTQFSTHFSLRVQYSKDDFETLQEAEVSSQSKDN